MRNSIAWQHELRAELVALRDLYGPLPMDASSLLEVELVLTLLNDYLPNEDPANAWAVLNGQPFPALLNQPLPIRQAVARMRHLLTRPLSRHNWTQRLNQYRGVPSPYPLYWLEERRIVPTGTALVASRLETMRTALTNPVLWAKQPVKFAEAGVYRFTADHEAFEVEIPGRLARTAPGAVQDVPPGQRQRSSLQIPLADLEAEADWMDQVSGSKNQRWYKVIRALRLNLGTTGGLDKSDALTIDGLLHLIGMVGSGKSTLLTVLAVYAARRGLRVMLVYGEVATLLREFAQFEQFRGADEKIRAMPIIGRSGRLNHLNRLHLADARQNGISLDLRHPGYEVLSTVCALDGLRRDVEPIRPGQEPCTRLYVRGQRETEQHRRDCPLMPRCPVHQASRELSLASVWLTTPAGLLASGTQTPLFDESLRIVELAMRWVDLLLVDEADLVQVQFDNRFAQIEVLVGAGESWLDRLYQQVAYQVYRPGRPLVGAESVIDRWLAVHANTQRAVDALYRWVREDADIRAWLSRHYFTGDRLMRRLQEELDRHKIDSTLLDEPIRAFLYDPLGYLPQTGNSGPPMAWLAAARRTLLGDELSDICAALLPWLSTHLPGFEALQQPARERLAHRLIIALVVRVLDQSLHEMILAWPAAAERLDLDRGNGALFFSPADSLERLIPEPPMGQVLGFQYYAPDDKSIGELRFFQVRGMGRSLLTHIHDALKLPDGVAGPHVVLTSGTSWAPGSWRYHLSVQPHAVLLPDWRDETAETVCIFDPIAHPDPKQGMLYVSGVESTNARLNSLREMVRTLARRGVLRGKSRFEQEFEQLPDDRQRILLVVGSYVQAKEVAKELSDALGKEPGDAVVALIPDSDGEPDLPPGYLQRSLISQFPTLDVPFLVAPLQAIERGHNILVDHQAAVGSVYFLVRPMPVPGDPYTAVQRMHAWAEAVVASLDTPTIGAAGVMFRHQAGERWERELSRDDSYRGMSDPDALLWTQLVLVWQCIGRLLRGGVRARVHFVDAKWAEVSSGLTKGPYDTEETSMLVGFQRILRRAMDDPESSRRAIAKTLYGSLAQALERIEGIIKEKRI